MCLRLLLIRALSRVNYSEAITDGDLQSRVKNVGTALSTTTMLSKRYLNGQEKGVLCAARVRSNFEQGAGGIKLMFL